MKRIIDYFRGCCRLTLTGCAPERCLQRLLDAGIAFWAMEKTDEFTLRLTVYQRYADIAETICIRCQCRCERITLPGFRSDFSGLRRRWVLLAGMAAVIAAMIVLPNYVFFLRVEGCSTAEETQILRALQDAGVGFGTRGTAISSERLRNAVLPKIPTLRWLAVNRTGMCAAVLTAERRLPEPVIDRSGKYTNLIACADGVITQLSVLNGQAACRPGDAVTKGQVVISGLMDAERIIVPTRALGEVYADTRRSLCLRTPCRRLRRTPGKAAGRCIYLTAGRKRIKICGSSGISMVDCVKMIRRKEWVLPGGYSLPVALSVETYYRTAPQAFTLSEAQARAILDSGIRRILDAELVAGRVHSVRPELSAADGCYCLTETVHCSEMIARSAEIPILELEQHGTNDQRRTDGTTD